MNNRNTIVAVVLMVLILWGGLFIQNVLNPSTAEVGTDGTDLVDSVADDQTTTLVGGAVQAFGDIPSPAPFIYTNDVMRVRFNGTRGSIDSIELLKYRDKDSYVQMLIQGDEVHDSLFDIAFGDVKTPVLDAGFVRREQSNSNLVVFYRDFVASGTDAPFRVTKIYRFHRQEYLFEFEVQIQNSVNEYIPLTQDQYAYTLHVGPQIGPHFEVLDQRNEYRRFAYLRREKRKNENINRKTFKTIDEHIQWVGTHGKYFALIVIPDATSYDIALSGESLPGLKDRASIFFSRPIVKSALVSDTYRVYVGPKVKPVLRRYDEGESNAFKVRGLNLVKITDSRVLLGWLESLLKILLQFLYSMIPNYGIAIILLTIIVKIFMIPLTNKSFASAARMQAISPQIKTLREQYKADPARLNKEISELYKREHVNPLSGCLPLLIQFPFFIAMFGLFSNHFDLRGALFIPGWIDDLSAPEHILKFGFTLPLLGWDSLRLLPIIFVLSQIFTAELSSSSTQASSDKQAKFMKYGLPIVFFFILYNMPSGLLVYWIFSNIASLVQQVIMQRIRR